MNKKLTCPDPLDEAISKLYNVYDIKDIRIFLKEKDLGLIKNDDHLPISSFIENVMTAAWQEFRQKGSND